MNDWAKDTLENYKDKGFASRSGYGKRPALLIVDFIVGFTDPTSPLGGDFSSELSATKSLIDSFRNATLPIIFTTIEYDEGFKDAGVFIKKVPSLSVLLRGSPMCAIDERIEPQHNEYIVSKKYASSFFGTNLDSHLHMQGVDTVVITGCTTSGCVRASAVDSLQYGFHTIVVLDGVGDRAQGPHEANLFDIDAKYADVVSANDVLEHINKNHAMAGSSGGNKQATDGFQRWWRDEPEA